MGIEVILGWVCAFIICLGIEKFSRLYRRKKHLILVRQLLIDNLNSINTVKQNQDEGQHEFESLMWADL